MERANKLQLARAKERKRNRKRKKNRRVFEMSGKDLKDKMIEMGVKRFGIQDDVIGVKI